MHSFITYSLTKGDNARGNQYYIVMNTATSFTILSAVIALAVSPIVIADSTSTAANPVEVETVEVDAAGTPTSDTSSKQKAEQMWEKTKKETGEAADAVADYSKEQGGRAAEGTKKGVSKGTEAVTTTSKKAWESTKKGASKGATAVSTASKQAWEATKDTTDKVLDSTGKALKKSGDALEGAFDDGTPPPVSDRSVEQGSTGSN